MAIEPNSLNAIKNTLKTLGENELREHLLRLSKYKKENKELLSFILYLEHDKNQFVKDVKLEIKSAFEILNRSNNYYTTKGLRKILRWVNKFIKFSGDSETEVELLLNFCENMRAFQIPTERSTVLLNMYNRQLDRARKAVMQMHEDKAGDYRKVLESLSNS